MRWSASRVRALRWWLVVVIVASAACGPSVAEDATGPEIYAAMCARCHAADLSGGIGSALAGAEAPSLDLPEAYLVQAVTRGTGRMPSYRGSLSEAQIQRVIDFILEQQGR